MAGPAGLEPVTSRVTGGCSNQLSYGPLFGLKLVAGGGIAPPIRLQRTYESHAKHNYFWCRGEDLHLRPRAYESLALTT